MTPAQMAKRIEVWPIGRLAPYDRNPRTHSPDQIEKIARSITEFGFTVPILVDENDRIIAGHGRLAAAKHLRLAQVPVIPLVGLTEAQKRAYVIADNRIALDAGWDDELLAGELAALSNEDFDLALTGFDEDEIQQLLEGVDGEAPGASKPTDAQLGIFVTCSSPRDQKALMRQLVKQGYECRAVN